MSKYDFGYEIVPGSTIEWAYEKVGCETTVLELGPATGNLVYHLVTEKKCVVDIVEMDEEAGRQAAKYSRNSCLGCIEGNLEHENWFHTLEGNQYDYVVVLDVLEHIRNPQEVLKCLKKLLKDEGVLLLSIPNISHNSVILNLLKNKFQYTAVGLLDDTHVHFYSYDSVKEMLNSNGFVTMQEQVKQEKVGSNEIPITYGNFPRKVEAYLKTREMGTAYQFLFTIKKGDVQSPRKVEYNRDLDKLYEIVVFDVGNNRVITQQNVNPNELISMEIAIPLQTKKIRIDPLNVNCILTDINISSRLGDEKDAISIKEFTGSQVGELFVFYDDDPQIYFEVPEGVRKVFFSCRFIDFDNEGLAFLTDMRDMLRKYQHDVEELNGALGDREQQIAICNGHMEKQKSDIETLNKELETLNSTLKDREQQIAICNEHMEKQKYDIEKLNLELQDIKKTIWGKAYYRLRILKKTKVGYRWKK